MAQNASSPTVGWPVSAVLAYNDAIQKGATPAQATDFASVQYGESGFSPTALNKSSGAAGLYQLLSQGYVNRANQMGGVMNPQANIEAILPNYMSYYQSHPGTPVPGAAGSAVEASGEPASYYAQGYQHLPGAPNVATGSAMPVAPAVPGATPRLPVQGSAGGTAGAGVTMALPPAPKAPTPVNVNPLLLSILHSSGINIGGLK